MVFERDEAVQAQHKHFQNPLPTVRICTVGGLPACTLILVDMVPDICLGELNDHYISDLGQLVCTSSVCMHFFLHLIL
jgi:hypothetical protein